MEPEKKAKRIVSKTALLHMNLRSGSLLCIFTVATIGFVTIAVACFLFAFNLAFDRFIEKGAAGFWFGFVLIGIFMTFTAYQFGGTAKDHCQELVDLKSSYTSVNTADLPAVDSLVRASEEPEQAQADVLLRTVADVQQTAPEQLLRATTGEEVRS